MKPCWIPKYLKTTLMLLKLTSLGLPDIFYSVKLTQKTLDGL